MRRRAFLGMFVAAFVCPLGPVAQVVPGHISSTFIADIRAFEAAVAAAGLKLQRFQAGVSGIEKALHRITANGLLVWRPQ